MLSFSPSLSGLESLNSHRSTLESFGKKVDEKAKSIRAAEILFAAKKADWDSVAELALELRANSEMIIILTEGMCERLFQAVVSVCPSVYSAQGKPSVQLVSSNLHSESLKSLADSVVGRKVSLFLAFHSTPSERLFWCFRVLLQALHRGRHAEEVKRRVVVTTGEAATEWERWAQRSPFRTISFPPRCANRYLFFCEPTALLMNFLGLSAWSYVEGGRSFLRQYDKAMETEDPVLAYAALREVQLAEHHRETLVLPDETYSGFGRWWLALTEDSRRAFAEEVNDGLVWTGAVMKEGGTGARLHWVTEIALDSDSQFDLQASLKDAIPPSRCPGLKAWSELESLYRGIVNDQRTGHGYAQPSIRVNLRRRDAFCLGALFCFFESVVSASHRLAETADNLSMYTPHQLSVTSVGA